MKNQINDYKAQIGRLNSKLFHIQKDQFEKIIATIKNNDFNITMIILNNSALTRKQYRMVLFNAIEAGHYGVSSYVTFTFFKRHLSYSEKARMANINHSFEWIENYFPERIDEIVAKATKNTAKKTPGHKIFHNGNIF